MLMQKFLSLVLSIFFSPFCAYLSFLLLDDFPDVLRIVGIIVAGFAAGMAQGALFGASCGIPIGVGAMFGAMLLWTPVVIITYGFALLGLPLLLAYACCVYLGVQCSARVYRPASRLSP